MIKYRNEKWLRNEYIILGKSSIQISKELDVDYTTICKWLKKFNIKTRHNFPTKVVDFSYRNKNWLEERYIEENLTMEKIAEECNVTSKTIYDWLKKYDILTRPSGFQADETNPSRAENVEDRPGWRGGKIYKQICKMCGSVEYKTKGNIQIFCSGSCRSAYIVKYCLKRCDTDIELMMEAWLNENKIIHNKQFYIKFGDGTNTLVDFFIEPNICLYCDGDFFHQLQHQIERDVRHNRELKKIGYKVIRLKGSEIRAGKRPRELLDEI